MVENSVRDDDNTTGHPQETPFFFGEGLFGVVHRPRERGLPGWVICNPFGKEKIRTHRLLFEWASFLAAAGHWVLRFDYRGTGDSRGAFEEFTSRHYVEDIASATVEIEKISAIPCRGLCGLRLGADLAAIVAANFERPLELVMWEPVVNGKRYIKSLLRTAMANEMVISKGAHRSRDDYLRELAEDRSVSVDGFPLASGMYESLSQIDSASLGRPTSAPILVVQMRAGRTRAPAPGLSKMLGIFAEEGEVSHQEVQALPVWMETRAFRWPPEELFNLTHAWMSGTVPQVEIEALPPEIGSSTSCVGTATERAVDFAVEGETVWGILHEPADIRDGRPTIVLLHAGDVSRSGFFYPQLARGLAERGWMVLRFDPRGLGDSHGDQCCEWLVDFFERVERGELLPDAVAALDFMEKEHAAPGSVLVGLCGGAVTSVYAAQADPRVVGIAPLDLPVELFRPAAWDQQEVSWLDVFAQRQSTLFLLKMHRNLHDFKRRVASSIRAIAAFVIRDSGHGAGSRWRYLEQLGEGANVALLSALEASFEAGIPACCVFAESTELLPRFKTVLPVLHSKSPRAEELLEVQIIEDADHNFIMPGCTEKLIAVLEAWLEGPRRPWFEPPDPTHCDLT